MHLKLPSLVIVLLPITATAMLPCLPRRTITSDMQNLSAKAMNVVLVGSADRKNATNYGLDHDHITPEAVESRYGATGDLSCPIPGYPNWGAGQAQVTFKNNVLTTAAHVFFTNRDCASLVKPSTCTFIIRVAGKEQRYAISPEFEAGYKCPHQGPFTSGGDDWMVLKLKKAVDSRVRPYDIRREGQASIGAGDELVAVGKSVDWPAKNTALNLLDRPRHYGDCNSQFAVKSGSSGSVEVDCDWSKGASGGSLVSRGPNPTLLAIVRGDTSKVPANCDQSLGADGHDSYHQHCWTNLATAVDGDFKSAILRAGGEALKQSPIQPDPSINNIAPGFKLPAVRL